MTDVKKPAVAKVETKKPPPETEIKIFFGPDARDVRVEIGSITNINPRKIEYAAKMLHRDFREVYGRVIHESAERDRQAKAKAEDDARRAADEAERKRQEEHAKNEEVFERQELERLTKKYAVKPTEKVNA